MLLLIDVSGSMKEQTDSTLRFAHSLAQATDRFEVFTLGTRLTRITRALRRRRADQALSLASSLVSDWDGGTRLGDALQAFLSVPRFAGFSRGALVVVLSDGLERGDPAAFVDAMARLSRLAWAVLWLSPLATSSDYTPETSALQAVLPYIDRLGDGSSAASLCREVLQLKGESHEDHRRPPPHLASGGSRLAARAKSAAHLRRLRPRSSETTRSRSSWRT